MDFKDWFYDNAQCGIDEESLEDRAEGRKGYIVCVGEKGHVNRESSL